MPHERITETPIDATADLQIYTLGPPQAVRLGQPLVITRRQARALLFSLAARRGLTAREQLCFLFWPDIQESSARRNLSRLLSQLRHALPAPDLLIAAGDQIGLDRDRVWSDAVTFRALCDTRQGQGRLKALQEAVSLYRGPFLDGFSLPHSAEFESWATTQARALEQHYLEALADLIQAYSTDGAIENAIPLAERYLATDELNEEMHRRLILLYAAAGDRKAAMRQFERCTAVLERELGVGPLPATRAAYESVAAGARQQRVSPPPETDWTTLPSLDVPLVGRQQVLEQLEDACERTLRGHGGVILISGESGIGKTRLLREFATRCAGTALIVLAAGQPGGQTLPYHPLVQLFRSLPMDQFSTSPAWLAEASRLLPELRDLHPHLPPITPAEHEEARVRLFEALCQILLDVAARSRVLLLCLDDLHWADHSTLEWLVYLARRIRNAPLLILGAHRSETDDVMSEQRRALHRLDVLTELQLEGLEIEAVRSLLGNFAQLDRTLEALAVRLLQTTGGNPFYLLETLRALMESGWPSEHPVSLPELPIPDTVRDAVNSRLARLSPVARQVAEAGAVLGPRFAFELLHQTAGRGELETLEGLEELTARQLVLEEGEGYRFQHEIIQAAVYRGLSLWRRRLLHRRAARASQALRPDDAAALAGHFERGDEHGQAAAYALQAGEAAKAIFAYVEARAFFNRALTLLESESERLKDSSTAEANRRLRIQALYGRGWAFRLLGDMEAYERDTQEVARLAVQLNDHHTLAHLHWREAYAHRWFCRYGEAQMAALEGLRLALAAGDRPLEGMCRREIGMAARETGAYEEAEVELETALGVFAELGDLAHQIHVLGNLSTLDRLRGAPQAALDRARKALLYCEKAGLSLERRLPLGDVGAAELALGDAEGAEAHLQESLAIARQIADRTQEIFCLGHLGWLFVHLHQAEMALAHLRAALDLAQKIDSCAEQSWLHAGLAAAYCLSEGPGSRREARVYAQRALDLAQTTGRPHDRRLACKIAGKLRMSGR